MYLVQDAREDVVDDRLSTVVGREAMPMAERLNKPSRSERGRSMKLRSRRSDDKTGLGMGIIDSSQIPQALIESLKA